MKTNLYKTHQGHKLDIYGDIEIELLEDFQATLETLKKKLMLDETVIIDLKNLNFVGSTGITNFLTMLKNFNQQAKSKPNYINVKNEFKQMIDALDEQKGFIFF
jgi:anti-anti-sigma regulatory factor